MYLCTPQGKRSSLKKNGKRGLGNKNKNYFQKSLPEKKQWLLLHPLTEMKAIFFEIWNQKSAIKKSIIN